MFPQLPWGRNLRDAQDQQQGAVVQQTSIMPHASKGRKDRDRPSLEARGSLWARKTWAALINVTAGVGCRTRFTSGHLMVDPTALIELDPDSVPTSAWLHPPDASPMSDLLEKGGYFRIPQHEVLCKDCQDPTHIPQSQWERSLA